jgi:Transposase DDE domain
MQATSNELLSGKPLEGLTYFRRLKPLLAPLHNAGCARDKAGNRTLHFDQYCSLIFLALFNPVARSLRGLSQASKLDKVQKDLGVQYASLGSLSEAAHVFDPKLLLPSIAELTAELRPHATDPRLGSVRHIVTAVDSTLVQALPCLTEAMYCRTKNSESRFFWRLHTHFEVDRHVPVRIDATDPAGRDHSDEKDVLRQHLQADHCYVLDRLFAQFSLFNDIADAHSSYVCRIKDNSNFEIAEERPLPEAARAAGVVQDAVVRLGMGSKATVRPHHKVRLVVVAVQPHEKRGGRKGKTAGPSSNGKLLIATNLLDPPAEIIALLYRYRWLIEIFFRFFKHVLGCKHLLSATPDGIAIQAYCALIACMLINIWTECRPNLRTYEMLCWYFLGWATEQELLAHLQELREKEKLKKQKQAAA